MNVVLYAQHAQGPGSISMPKIKKEESTCVLVSYYDNLFFFLVPSHCWEEPGKQLMCTPWLSAVSQTPSEILPSDKRVTAQLAMLSLFGGVPEASRALPMLCYCANLQPISFF